MKKKMLAAFLAACLGATAAFGALADFELTISEQTDGACAISQFVIVSQDETSHEESEAQWAFEDQIAERIEARFAQSRAETSFKMAQLRKMTDEMFISQKAKLFETPDVYSLSLLWRGEQEDGRDGCSWRTMTLDRHTGEEITLESLFTDADAAFALMEEIISEDVLDGISDYVEFADLLPMPRDCWSLDETGITVYWQDDVYRTLDGLAGSVHFMWQERGLNTYVAPESCAYALATAQDDVSVAERAGRGMLENFTGFALGETLETLAGPYAMNEDADNTRTSKVFFFEDAALRGWSLEIPKYAETEDEDTPVTAIRSSRISAFGLTTGVSTQQDALQLLGEAAQKQVYGEDGYDWMLEPAYGESWFYEISGRVLQLHFDEDGVLRMMILRTTMPESLY